MPTYRDMGGNWIQTDVTIQEMREEIDRIATLELELAEARELLREGYEACCFGGSEKSEWLDQLGEKIDEWDNLMSRAAIDTGKEE